jgi:uncharacterized membrane protein
MLSTYNIFKALHILGVILLVGNVTVSAVWKVFADRTRNAPIIAHAQRLVTITDWSLTLSGIILIMIGGYGVAYAVGQNPFGTYWLILGQVLFAVSGTIWLLILVPIQVRQAHFAKKFESTGTIPGKYWKDSHRWLIWGVVATVPLVAAMYVMVAKP